MIIHGRVRYSSLFSSTGQAVPNGVLKVGALQTRRTDLVCSRLNDLLHDRFQREIFLNPTRLGEFQIAKPYRTKPIFPFQGAVSEVLFLCSMSQIQSRLGSSPKIILPAVFDEDGLANKDLSEVSLESIVAVAVAPKPYVMKLTGALTIIGVSLKIAGIIHQKEVEDKFYGKSIGNSSAD